VEQEEKQTVRRTYWIIRASYSAFRLLARAQPGQKLRLENYLFGERMFIVRSLVAREG